MCPCPKRDPKTRPEADATPAFPSRRLRRGKLRRGAGLLLLLAILLAGAVATAEPTTEPEAKASEPCAVGATLATGAPDPAIFAREASKDVRAFWCETYDTDGNALRAGVYWEVYPDGATRTRSRYVDSRIEGPVEVFDEAGGLWLRGDLDGGEWSGPLELFHPNGVTWLSARFRSGRLDGPVETRFPDGRVESSTHFQNGHEDGIATSYYPTSAGGGLRSQVRVEVDEIVENPPRPTPAAAEAATEPERDETAHVSAARIESGEPTDR
jgi:hypothetical protein